MVKGAAMLKGNNSLHMNFATVMEAFEEYLNARLLPAAKVRVTGINPLNDHIVVKIEPRKAPEGGEQ
jgi:hypothetical protein